MQQKWVRASVSELWHRTLTRDVFLPSSTVACSQRTRKRVVWLCSKDWIVIFKMTGIQRAGDLTTSSTQPMFRSKLTQTKKKRKEQDKCDRMPKQCWFAFFTCNVRRTVHKEFIPPREAVNQEFHLRLSQTLSENVQGKHLDLWRTTYLFLRHRNSPYTWPWLCNGFKLLRAWLSFFQPALT